MKRLVLGVITVVLASLCCQSVTSAAPLARPDKRLNITLIGDSYTSGNGAGAYYGEGKAHRSHLNWGSLYTLWLNYQGVSTRLKNLAVSGNTTSDIKNEQLNGVSTDTNLVMLTAGGNDANFEAIVTKCLLPGARSYDNCKSAIDYAQSQFSGIKSRTKEIFQNLENKLAPDSEIVLVGYPLLSTNTNYQLGRQIAHCTQQVFFYCAHIEYTTEYYPAAQKIRELGRNANTMQQALVSEWNKSHKLKVRYVGNISDAFAGHEPHPSFGLQNTYRWMDEFLEKMVDADDRGNITSSVSADPSEWYHPGIIGHSKIAEVIEKAIGIPNAAQRIPLAIGNDTGDNQGVFGGGAGNPGGAGGDGGAGGFGSGGNGGGALGGYGGDGVGGANGAMGRPVRIQHTHSPRVYLLPLSVQRSPRATLALDSSPTGDQLQPPSAWIDGPYVIKIGGTLTIDARGSYPGSGDIVRVDWDLDGDGVYETREDSLLIQRTFSQAYSGTIGVKLTDSHGLTDIYSTQLDVTDDGDTIPRGSDNCPDEANLSQADSNHNGIGDDCEINMPVPRDLPGVIVREGDDGTDGSTTNSHAIAAPASQDGETHTPLALGQSTSKDTLVNTHENENAQSASSVGAIIAVIAAIVGAAGITGTIVWILWRRRQNT